MTIRRIIACILILTLSLAGLGHAENSPTNEAQADAYILAGGSWSDLCGDAENSASHAEICLACLLSQTSALAEPAHFARPADTFAAITLPRCDVSNAMPSLHATPAARAPPFVLSGPTN
ncbi:MAG: hypothetical protein AAFQ09_01100 [Pseudomonadota bacterium]